MSQDAGVCSPQIVARIGRNHWVTGPHQSSAPAVAPLNRHSATKACMQVYPKHHVSKHPNSLTHQSRVSTEATVAPGPSRSTAATAPNAATSSGSSNSSSRLSWQGQQQTSAAQHLSDKQVLSTAGDCESAAWRVGHSGCIDCSGNLGQCWYDAV